MSETLTTASRSQLQSQITAFADGILASRTVMEAWRALVSSSAPDEHETKTLFKVFRDSLNTPMDNTQTSLVQFSMDLLQTLGDKLSQDSDDTLLILGPRVVSLVGILPGTLSAGAREDVNGMYLGAVVEEILSVAEVELDLKEIERSLRGLTAESIESGQLTPDMRNLVIGSVVGLVEEMAELWPVLHEARSVTDLNAQGKKAFRSLLGFVATDTVLSDLSEHEDTQGV